MLSQEIYRVSANTSPDSTTLISPSSAVHTASCTSSYHLALTSFRDHGRGRGTEHGSGVDVASHHHISLSVADLNARSAIVLAIMLTSSIIVMMIFLLQLAQLLFSTLMIMIQSIPTGMLTPEPPIT